jgi:trigger factor
MKAVESSNPAELQFEAIFEVYPQFELTDLSQLSVERPQVEITAADIDAELHDQREEHGSYKVVERAAELGDFATVSYSGTLDGAPLPDGESATDSEFVLGDVEDDWKAFDAEIVGLKAGESKVFHFTYPENYGNEGLAGKTAQFHLTVSEVGAWEPAEINAEFARKNGIDDGDVDKLRAKIEDDLRESARKLVTEQTRRGVFDALLATHSFATPMKLVEEKARQKRAQFMKITGWKESDSDEALPSLALLIDETRQEMCLDLIIGKIDKLGDFQVTSEQLYARIGEIARKSISPDKTIAWYSADPAREDSVAVELLKEQIADWVLDQARVVDVPCSYQALKRRRLESCIDDDNMGVAPVAPQAPSTAA